MLGGRASAQHGHAKGRVTVPPAEMTQYAAGGFPLDPIEGLSENALAWALEARAARPVRAGRGLAAGRGPAAGRTARVIRTRRTGDGDVDLTPVSGKVCVSVGY